MRGHVIVGVMTISADVDKLYDTDLTDAAWALIAPMLPTARPGGRPRKIDIRAVLNAIPYIVVRISGGTGVAPHPPPWRKWLALISDHSRKLQQGQP